MTYVGLLEVGFRKTMKQTKRLLLVGWDGADWQVAKPLIDAGRMPALESLIAQGVMGNLASMDP
jgi:predicted AlkP superfamily phosphohydrolase/phosphomutase